MIGAAMQRKTFSGAGRPRKPGLREKNGRHQRSAAVVREDVMGVVKKQRLRFVGKDDVLSQEAESPLGILRIRKIVTDDELEAGKAYAALVRAAKRSYDSPSEDPAPGGLTNMLPGSGGAFLNEETLFTPEQLRERHYTVRARYNTAFEVLGEAGREALMAVNDAAVRELHILPSRWPALKQGLDRLRRHLHQLDKPSRAR
jgi:hypothetical protein